MMASELVKSIEQIMAVRGDLPVELIADPDADGVLRFVDYASYPDAAVIVLRTWDALRERPVR